MEAVTPNSLCFGLYSLSRVLIKRYNRILAPYSLTYTQYLVLSQLWSNPALRMRTLEKNLNLDSNTLTPVIKKLESRGFLHKRRAVGDERSLILRITDEGLALEREIAPSIAQAEAELPLAADERERLAAILNKLMDAE